MDTIALWIGRAALAWAAFILCYGAWIFASKPAALIRRRLGIEAPDVSLRAYVRISSGGFHLALGLIALVCLFLDSRIVTGLCHRPATTAVVQATRIFGTITDDNDPRGRKGLRNELLTLVVMLAALLAQRPW